MPNDSNFDVLVVGSGASGLAAAVSADRAGARVALATKGSIQACNSAKAQGGIQAAFGEDDSPEQHAADVFKSSHETADLRLVEVLTGDARGAIHWLEELARLGGFERLRDFGVPEPELDEVAEAVVVRPGARANPRPATAAEVAGLLRSIW